MSVENRRESFRLEDKLLMQVNIVDPDQRDLIVNDFESFRLRFSLGSHFQAQREIRKPKLLRIRKRDPEVSSYLEHIEDQLLLLAGRISECDDESAWLGRSEVSVCLSSGGMRYCSTEPLLVGQMVQVRMLLSTIGTEVLLIANVIRVDEENECRDASSVQISLEFTCVHPADEEALIRHLAKLQQIQLQKRREN